MTQKEPPWSQRGSPVAEKQRKSKKTVVKNSRSHIKMAKEPKNEKTRVAEKPKQMGLQMIMTKTKMESEMKKTKLYYVARNTCAITGCEN